MNAMTPLTPIDLSPAERAAGLTEPLPAGERILWQGKPDGGALTRSVFHFRGLALYGLGVAALVAAVEWQTRPLGQSIAVATMLLPFFLAGFGLLALVGRASARATTYTLTNRRIVMHIGVAYEMTVSIPLSAVVGAAMREHRDGSGEIALRARDVGGISYVALWPHARFGRFRRPEPMLRGIAEPELVRDLIGEALVAFNAGGRSRTPAMRLVAEPEGVAA